MRDITIHPEVAEALESGTPVVALESAVVTAGLPSQPHKLAQAAGVDSWNDSAPANLEAARAMMNAVRASGAVPAIAAILDGHVHLGLPADRLPKLIEQARGAKATVRDFGVLLATGRAAGTTVAGTLRACTMVGEGAISVMATGGIGGVHHTWPAVPDVSADLIEIARTPIAVVCSGAKSVLDVPATMELLETLSVPVVGFGVDALPAFYLRKHDGLAPHARLDTPAEVAALLHAHWNIVRAATGVIVAQPVASSVALDAAELAESLEQAQRDLDAAGTTGTDVTPELLRRLADATAGRSLDANISLLAANAHLAGQVAGAIVETT